MSPWLQRIGGIDANNSKQIINFSTRVTQKPCWPPWKRVRTAFANSVYLKADLPLSPLFSFPRRRRSRIIRRPNALLRNLELSRRFHQWSSNGRSLFLSLRFTSDLELQNPEILFSFLSISIEFLLNLQISVQISDFFLLLVIKFLPLLIWSDEQRGG